MTQTETERLEKTADQLEAERDERALEVAQETLTGDVRDIILNDLKNLKTSRPWNERSQGEQEMMVTHVTFIAAHVVARVVEIVAAGGRKTIKAMLGQLTVKDGIKAVLEISKYDEQRHELMDIVGSPVLIVLADPAQYEGARAKVEIKKDQTSILDAAAVQPEAAKTDTAHNPETGEIL